MKGDTTHPEPLLSLEDEMEDDMSAGQFAAMLVAVVVLGAVAWLLHNGQRAGKAISRAWCKGWGARAEKHLMRCVRNGRAGL